MPPGKAEPGEEQLIRGTAEHPFYVYGKGWTPLGELKPGDWIRTDDGWVEVNKVEDTGHYETVYNLKVADYHTYFVGAQDWGFGVWAHNAFCGHDSQGRKMFRNDESHLLEGELRLADNLGVRPMRVTDPEFAQTARQAGGRMLWVQRADGEVVFVPRRVVSEHGDSFTINHTAASRGADVLSAGEANVYISRNGRATIRELTNQSGHYAPHADTPPQAVDALRQQGVDVIRVNPVGGS